MAQHISPSATGAAPSGASSCALVVHSSDDDMDNPVQPVLVHSEGQPSGLGRTLWTLVRRDGYDTTLAMLGRGGVWTKVAAETGSLDQVPGPGVLVAGYGVHHPQDDIPTLAQIEEAMADDDVWWYVVEHHGMVIDYRHGQQRREVAFVGWNDPEPNWTDFDGAVSDHAEL